MPASGRWFVTPHAVHRLRQLWPWLTYEHALAILMRDSVTAHRIRAKNPDADLYRGPRPHRLRYIVAHPKAPGELPQLLTVLPTFGGREHRKETEHGRIEA